MSIGHDEEQSDPFELLGVPPDADEGELRRAYLAKVKQFPPDRAPVEFERIRDAYDAARSPRIRARRMLTAVDPFAPLARLVEDAPTRRFVGAALWLAALKEP